MDLANRPIGVFDSGFGGLTVAKELIRTLPQESILYFGDSARCPYGPRDSEEVRGFVRQICTWLVARDVKLIVIACNTATASGLAMAQQQFDVPIIGVVEPGARAAVQATANRNVGVIGTKATIESGAYSDAIRALDAGITVYSAATPRFVEIAEQGVRLNPGVTEDFWASVAKVYIRPAFQEIAQDYLGPLKQCGIDTLVLGCTHYPLLKALIGATIGHDVKLISSSTETAKEVLAVLQRRQQLATGQRRLHFATSGQDLEEFQHLAQLFLGEEIDAPEYVDVQQLIAGCKE